MGGASEPVRPSGYGSTRASSLSFRKGPLASGPDRRGSRRLAVRSVFSKLAFLLWDHHILDKVLNTASVSMIVSREQKPQGTRCARSGPLVLRRRRAKEWLGYWATELERMVNDGTSTSGEPPR